MCMKAGAPEKPAKGACRESHRNGNYYTYPTTAATWIGNATNASNTYYRDSTADTTATAIRTYYVKP